MGQAGARRALDGPSPGGLHRLSALHERCGQGPTVPTRAAAVEQILVWEAERAQEQWLCAVLPPGLEPALIPLRSACRSGAAAAPALLPPARSGICQRPGRPQNAPAPGAGGRRPAAGPLPSCHPPDPLHQRLPGANAGRRGPLGSSAFCCVPASSRLHRVTQRTVPEPPPVIPADPMLCSQAARWPWVGAAGSTAGRPVRGRASGRGAPCGPWPAGMAKEAVGRQRRWELGPGSGLRPSCRGGAGAPRQWCGEPRGTAAGGGAGVGSGCCLPARCKERLRAGCGEEPGWARGCGGAGGSEG